MSQETKLNENPFRHTNINLKQVCKLEETQKDLPKVPEKSLGFNFAPFGTPSPRPIIKATNLKVEESTNSPVTKFSFGAAPDIVTNPQESKAIPLFPPPQNHFFTFAPVINKPEAKSNKYVDKPEDFNPKIKELWTSGRFSDLTIVADTKRFKVHRTILGMSSSVFTKIIEEHGEAAEIKIHDFSPSAVEALLLFIYTSEIEVEGNAEENLSIATKFELSKMKLAYEKLLCDQLNPENAFDLFSLAHRNSAEKLKKKAFAIVASEFPKGLSDKFMDNPEKLQKLIEARRDYEKLMDE